jgi:hypothetical protein
MAGEHGAGRAREALRRAKPFAILLCLTIGACGGDGTGPVTGDAPAEFISVRRAWLPGERAATIARVKANREFDFLYVGDISDDADLIFADPDSVVEVVANPDFSVRAASSGSLLVMEPRFASTWTITGVDVRIVNKEVTPVADTTHWIGVFWNNPAETNWKGFILAAANTNPATVTVPQTSVNTAVFDAAFGKSGIGGGEQRTSTTTFWQANAGGIAPNNTLTISSAVYGTASTVTTGPFLGGTVANGTMQGRMRTINMTRITGATAPLTFTVDFDFSITAISSIRYVCVFRTPCTTNVP